MSRALSWQSTSPSLSGTRKTLLWGFVLSIMISRSQSRKPPSIHDWKLHENIASRRSLLAARDLMAGVAKLAEQVMMHDLSPEMWNQIDTTKPEAAIASLRASLCCREPSTRLAVDKVGDTFMLPEEQAAACPVRKLRAEQAVQLKRAFKARVVEWIDTGAGNEKPAVVMRWRYNRSPPSSSASSADSDGGGEEDLIVVSFRGSKTLRDIFLVDAMSPIFHVPVPPAAEEQPPAGSSFSPLLGFRSELPCCSSGVWSAYAGDTSERKGLSPRHRVRACVERLLAETPHCKVVLSGHSLGGCLATVCAYDLLQSSSAVQSAGITLLCLGGVRFFNEAFQIELARRECEGSLAALHITNRGDVIPRMPPRSKLLPLGGCHGVPPRLHLDPDAADEFATNYWDGYEFIASDGGEPWVLDPHAHNSHALFLAGDGTATRSKTVSKLATWPSESLLRLPSRVLPNAPLVSPPATKPAEVSAAQPEDQSGKDFIYESVM